MEPGTAISALGLFANHADKLKGITLNGIISELIDYVCDLYKINRQKLIEFFLIK